MPAPQSVHCQGLCKNGTVEMCSFPELFFSQRFIWMIRLQTPHRPTPYPSPMSIWCHIYKTLPLLQAACLAPSPKLPSLAVRQAACRRYRASTALLHPSLTGFPLSLERYSTLDSARLNCSFHASCKLQCRFTNIEGNFEKSV